MTQKEIARILDRAAERADAAEYAAASSKQVWFLAGLMAQKGETPEAFGYGLIHTHATLTSRAASALIDRLSGAAAAREADAAQAAAATTQQVVDIQAQRAATDAVIATVYAAEWAAAEAMTGVDRREAKRLLRRRFDAEQAAA